jgi:two-component system sensor histidine kinase TctE
MNPARRHAPQETKARRSLFADVLDWMLVPLLIVWPLGVGATYIISVGLADSALDQALVARLRTFTVHVSWFAERGDVSIDINPETLFPNASALHYRVQDAHGNVLAGDAELPYLEPPMQDRTSPGIVTGAYLDERVRSASVWHKPPGAPFSLLVVLAEPMERRSKMAYEIMRDMMIPQCVIVISMVLLMWFGLREGVAPLERLRARVAAREPNDLSPLEAPEAPIEVEPLIDEFNNLLRRVEHAGVAQRRFIANAAHQLRTPIAGIKTQTELALRDPDPESQRIALDNIAKGTSRAAHLINQLLALARTEAEAAVEMKSALLDLRDTVRQTTETALPRAQAKGIDLGVELPYKEVMVAGDATLLAELLANLIDNAIVYTQNAGHITVRASAAADGSPILEVEDDGIGIPEAERELVFERFHRVVGTGTQGSGLGLAIVREVASRHRAKVQVFVPPGGAGTLMRVIFPPPFPQPSPPPIA